MTYFEIILCRLLINIWIFKPAWMIKSKHCIHLSFSIALLLPDWFDCHIKMKLVKNVSNRAKNYIPLPPPPNAHLHLHISHLRDMQIRLIIWNPVIANINQILMLEINAPAWRRAKWTILEMLLLNMVYTPYLAQWAIESKRPSPYQVSVSLTPFNFCSIVSTITYFTPYQNGRQPVKVFK